MEKIKTIVDPEFRRGTTKNGTPYTLMKVTTDTGKEANAFAPAEIGDPVKLTYSEQYHNYSAEVLTSKKMTLFVEEEKKDEKLNDIIEKLDEIIEMLGKKEQARDEKSFDEEEVSLDDIAF